MEERPETPEGGCTEKHDENHSGEAAGSGSFAPRLEHRNRSNEEKEDRAGSEDFQQYVLPPVHSVSTQWDVRNEFPESSKSVQ